MTLQTKVPPLIICMAMAFVPWKASWLAPQLSMNFHGQKAVALFLMIGGAITIIVAASQFYRHRTTINPHNIHGSRALLQHGLFAHSRNPIYLGMLLWVAASCVWYGNPIGLVAIPLFIIACNVLQIWPEENALERLFGDEYVAYRQRVRRWV